MENTHHDELYARNKAEAGERIARIVWRTHPPETRGEVVEALLCVAKNGTPEEFVEAFVSAIEWIQAHYELAEKNTTDPRKG